MRLLVSSGGGFQAGKIEQGFVAIASTHRSGRAQSPTHLRSFGLAEQATVVVFIELNTAHTGRFPIGHAGDGRANRGRDAAGTAAATTGIDGVLISVAHGLQFCFRQVRLGELSIGSQHATRAGELRPSIMTSSAQIASRTGAAPSGDLPPVSSLGRHSFPLVP